MPIYVKEDIYGFQHSKYAARLRNTLKISGKQNIATFKLITKNGKEETGLTTGHKSKGTARYITLPSIPNPINSMGKDTPKAKNYADQHSERMVMLALDKQYKDISTGKNGKHWIKWIYTERQPCLSQDYYNPCDNAIRKLEEEQIKQGGPPIVVYYTFAYNETIELSQKSVSDTHNYPLSNDKQNNAQLMRDIATDISISKKLMESGDPTGNNFRLDNKDEKFASALKLQSVYRNITRPSELRIMMVSANPYDIEFSPHAQITLDHFFAKQLVEIFKSFRHEFDTKSLESCKHILDNLEHIHHSFKDLQTKGRVTLTLDDARRFYNFLSSNLAIVKSKYSTDISQKNTIVNFEKAVELIDANINLAKQNYIKNIDQPIYKKNSDQIKNQMNEMIAILTKINANKIWDKPIEELAKLQIDLKDKILSSREYNTLYNKLKIVDNRVDIYFQQFNIELNELIYLIRCARVFFYREMLYQHKKESQQGFSSQTDITHRLASAVSHLDKFLEEIRRNIHVYGTDYTVEQSKDNDITYKDYSILSNFNDIKSKYNLLIENAKAIFKPSPTEFDFALAYEQAKSHYKQSSQTGMKNLPGLNATRLYRDDDINDYLSIYIDKSLGGFDKNHKYLINRKNIASINNDPNLLVAVTPAIDVYGRALKIDHFLNKQGNEENALAAILQSFIKDNNGTLRLKSLRWAILQHNKYGDGKISSIENKLSEEISGFLGSAVDKDTLKVIYKELLQAEFDDNKIAARVKELNLKVDRRDVFDDVIPLLRSEPNNKARILMPYNHQGRNHWLTCEINIACVDNHYTIDIFTHDPYGGGKMPEENFALLQKTIMNRITHFYDKDIDDELTFTFNNNESRYGRRQAVGDGNACGVITIEDMINRIYNKNLNQTYSKNATNIRENQINLVRSYQLETGDKNRGHSFIERSFQSDYIYSNSKNATWRDINYNIFSNTSSSNTNDEDKSTRLYSDEDINDILEIYIANTIGFRDKNKYLINNNKLKNNAGNLIAVSPAIDVMGRSLKLDHFLNKQGNSRSILADHLSTLLPQLETLKAQQSKLIEILMTGLSGIDKAGAQFITSKLIEKKFDKNSIEEYIQELNNKIDNHDILDEIIPLIKANINNSATILSPYNYQDRNHWLTCQINITFKDNQYQIDIFAHDPYGGGTMPKENYELLCKTIESRIMDFYKIDINKPTFQFNSPKSPYKTRQNDTNSCGVITVEDMINIIENNKVDENAYQKNAPELRNKNIARIKEYQLITGDKLRGKTFLQRNDASTDIKKLTDNTAELLIKNIDEIISKIENKDLLNSIKESFMNTTFFDMKDGSYGAGIHSVLGSAPQQLLLKGIKLCSNDLTQVSSLYNLLFHPEGIPKVEISDLFKYFKPDKTPEMQIQKSIKL